MTDTEARIYALLRELYTVEGIEVWLQGRNALLGDERPTDLMDRGESDRVLAVLLALAEGAFV